jgi:hypothetical protein
MRPDALDPDKKQGGAERFGLKTYGEMAKAYFEAVREHATEKGYLPIIFGSDDEYLIHPGGNVAQLEQYHRILRANGAGYQFIPFDSIYPDERPNLLPEYEKMLSAVDCWCAGLHSPKLAELVAKAGSKLWLYNTGMNRFTFGTYMFFARKKYDVSGFF